MEAHGCGLVGNNVGVGWGVGCTIYEQNNVQSLQEISENEAGKFAYI